MFEYESLRFLVSLNIALFVIKWLWEWNQDKGLKPFEFHWTILKLKDEILDELKEVLENDNTEAEKEAFNRYLRTSDKIKRLSDTLKRGIDSRGNPQNGDDEKG